ncbi:ISL3 family transposase [Companilactobacillus crustorum]|uniref:ISL3 family transposase n=1 Tax=Companilactobacillus crustorum TaxID=392416 RepID=UPI003B8A8D21
MSLSNKSIRNALEMKDENIIFTEDSKFMLVNGIKSLVYFAMLTKQIDRCLNCGLAGHLVKNGFNKNMIVAPSLSLRPTYISLKRQKYKCKSCNSIFVAKTSYVWEYCQIAQPVRQMILSETAFNTSLKDIGRRFNVSDKTVQRIIDEEAKMHKKSLPEHLPKHMAFDEFMSTDKMSFIWLDSDNHRTGDILPRRTSYQISKYFSRFPLKVRRQVKTISLDLNAGYINLVPKLFPKAKVVVDRFHIVQMMNRSLNSTRIQVMKRMPKRSKEYLFMKRDWKKFLESFDSIEKINPKYQYSVGYYETDLNLITKCLDLDEGFAKSYEVYQDIFKAIKTGDTDTMNQILLNYHPLNTAMDQTMTSLRKYRKQVLNALKLKYSNGFLEGIIGRIKKIKSSAYGYRSWNNFTERINIQMFWLRASSSAK